MSKYNIGDIVEIRHFSIRYLIIDILTPSFCKYVVMSISDNAIFTTVPENNFINSATVTMSSPKIYTGPLTQEEIDEIIESYNNSVQAVLDQVLTLPYRYNYSGDLNRGFDIVDFEDRNYGEPPKLSCKHEFVGVQLLMSTVYNCKKCGIKKEDV